MFINHGLLKIHSLWLGYCTVLAWHVCPKHAIWWWQRAAALNYTDCPSKKGTPQWAAGSTKSGSHKAHACLCLSSLRLKLKGKFSLFSDWDDQGRVGLVCADTDAEFHLFHVLSTLLKGWLLSNEAVGNDATFDHDELTALKGTCTFSSWLKKSSELFFWATKAKVSKAQLHLWQNYLLSASRPSSSCKFFKELFTLTTWNQLRGSDEKRVIRYLGWPWRAIYSGFCWPAEKLDLDGSTVAKQDTRCLQISTLLFRVIYAWLAWLCCSQVIFLRKKSSLRSMYSTNWPWL